LAQEEEAEEEEEEAEAEATEEERQAAGRRFAPAEEARLVAQLVGGP
jgi:hypothetical protein